MFERPLSCRIDLRGKIKHSAIALGVYPVTSFDARHKAEYVRIEISEGIDPSDTRKKSKAGKKLAAENKSRLDAGLLALNSFEHVAREWLAFPILGDMAIKEIKSADVLKTLKPLIDKSQLETAHRLHSKISSIFAYAIVHRFTDYDSAQPEMVN